MSDFFRCPHTPHIAWLGEGLPRDDKVLSQHEVDALLSEAVVVEEKLDGANLGISTGPGGKLHAQNRGQYLIEPFSGQFSRLNAWLGQHHLALVERLGSHLILFGEWCAAKHSLDYDALPDWLVVIDVFDLTANRFWSCTRRDLLAGSLKLATVPQLFAGKITLVELKAMLVTSTSSYRQGPPEGLVIRRESGEWCHSRAKLVRAEFTQSIGAHWRNRSIEWNRIKPSRSPSNLPKR